MPDLSPRVLAAMAALESQANLQRRTTLRRDDVDVLTDLLVPHMYYESMVRAPQAVIDALRARGIADVVTYETRDDADAGHDALCDRVGDVLTAIKAGKVA